MKICDNVLQLVGNTPAVWLAGFSSHFGLQNAIIGKLEYFNPSGSVKDRAALGMINAAHKQGLIQPGDTIVEPTSGNTGVGLAMVCAILGYNLILTMPETMSVERRKLLAQLGARLVLTPADKGMAGSTEQARRLADELGAFMPMQFSNPANPQAHRETTVPELLEQVGRVDAFVAGVGTAGTITGVGSALKQKQPGALIVAVEPASSPLISQGKAGAHGIQGIGANFIPDNLDMTVIDEVITVEDTQAVESARLLARLDGILVGISSGAAAYAAAIVAKRTGLENIVALLPDTGERYLSTELFDS